MKKHLFLMAAATVMLTSCHKVEFSQMNDSEILFGSKVMQIETKSFTESTDALLQANGYKVAAVIDGDKSTMFNKAVAYDNGAYSVPNEHYYYPNTGTMSFYAVYPKTEVITIAEGTGAASITYTQNADEDLIVAKALGVSKQPKKVDLKFSHLLSQIDFTVKTDDANVDCKVYSVTVTDAVGGTYSFGDDSWTPNTNTGAYAFLTNASGKAITTSATAIDTVMSLIPGTVQLNVKWKCFNKIGGQLISDNDETVEIDLVKGKHLTYNLMLLAKSSEIQFTSTIKSWVSEAKVRTMGYKPELLSGVFTVGESGFERTKVRFVKGNLYWNGSEFLCEENQYDSPTTYDENHVGNFLWSRDARVACAKIYNDANKEFGITPDVNDKLFAVDGGVFEGLTILNNEQWQYLIDHALATNDGEEKYTSKINGKKCLIFKPDNFSGTVKASYTAEEWVAAEASGLVALPFAGCRMDNVTSDADGDGRYWSSSPNDQDGKPNYALFEYETIMSFKTKIGPTSCSSGHSIRLVQVQ